MAGYIGNYPTAIPLTGADLTDGIITSAKIADGTIASVDLASGVGGKVLQVVTATDSTSRTTTSTSFVTASNTLAVTITPNSISSKIFIIINTTMLGADVYYTIYRDSTNLGTATGFGGISSASARCAGAISVVDSPSSTSAITYQLYVKIASGTAYINVDGNKGSITAMEIAG